MSRRLHRHAQLRSGTVSLLPAILAIACASSALAQAAPLQFSDSDPAIDIREQEHCDASGRCTQSTIIAAVAVMPEPAAPAGADIVRVDATFTNSGPDRATDVPLIIGLSERYACDDAQSVIVSGEVPPTHNYRISELLSSSTTIGQLDFGQSLTFSFKCQVI